MSEYELKVDLEDFRRAMAVAAKATEEFRHRLDSHDEAEGDE